MLPSSCQILEILAIAVPEFPGRSRFSGLRALFLASLVDWLTSPVIDSETSDMVGHA